MRQQERKNAKRVEARTRKSIDTKEGGKERESRGTGTLWGKGRVLGVGMEWECRIEAGERQSGW